MFVSGMQLGMLFFSIFADDTSLKVIQDNSCNGRTDAKAEIPVLWPPDVKN